MRIIAFITDGPTVRDILVHLGEPITPPTVAPARACDRMRKRRARRRAWATRATRKNTPTATHDLAFSPSTRTRQPVMRCHSRHLMRLDFLSVVIR